MIIAAVAEANDCVLVTDNEKDFIGLKIVNPLRAATEDREKAGIRVRTGSRVCSCCYRMGES